MGSGKTKPRRPRLFIGSSSAGRPVADILKQNLEADADTVIWHERALDRNVAPLDELDQAADEFDFAAFVLTPEDIAVIRADARTAMRDDLLFEAGLFLGRLRRERAFIVCPWDSGIYLPSNLVGMTMAHYPAESTDGLEIALGPASTRIREAIAQLKGRRQQPARALTPKSSVPKGTVPRPRRCNSLGIALARSQKDELRIVNISVSGALLETPGELPVGKTLELDLRLDNGILISVTARVVRVQHPDWQRIGGVGVAFTSVSEESARALRAFVELDSRAA